MMSSCSKHRTTSTIPLKDSINLEVTAPPGIVARHRQLLNTNEPPEGPEIAYVQAVISKTDMRLTCLDDEISRFQDRPKLASYRAQNIGIISPLRRMPPEVLGEIFSWTSLSVTEALDYGGFSIKKGPWLVTHVSSHWRTIALSTPSLWSLVAIDYDTDFVYPLAMSLPNLVEARILITFDDDLPDSDTVIDLLHLRRLFVGRTNILDYLRTPALEGIAIYVWGEEQGPVFCLTLYPSSNALPVLCEAFAFEVYPIHI
ncbi:hypothetical protein DFH07DRAFT_1055785 [Mycena maculata]|uniref:F-box domain-containing protein n=1 Tax=Mycena maculata TaxID=230809 RepID=A0AAD7NYG2_9AGAR|nr:hypothetical protein DFH07DRAFT_1055785 [Mycena maculata]